MYLYFVKRIKEGEEKFPLSTFMNCKNLGILWKLFILARTNFLSSIIARRVMFANQFPAKIYKIAFNV